MKKPTDRVSTLKNKEMLNERGKVIPAEKPITRRYTLLEAKELLVKAQEAKEAKEEQEAKAALEAGKDLPFKKEGPVAEVTPVAQLINYSLIGAHGALRPKSTLQEYDPRIAKITSDVVVISSAHKLHRATKRTKPEPEQVDTKAEPIEVVEKPKALVTDHKGEVRERPVPDYTAN